MTETTKTYEPQEETHWVYTVTVPTVHYLTGIISSDAPEDYTKEILLDSFKEQNEDIAFVEFRVATDEEILEFTEMMKSNETVN